MADEFLPHRGSLLERKTWTNVKSTFNVIDWSKDYIVYLDEDGALDWDTSPEFDQRTNANSDTVARHNAILADAALLEAKPSGDLSAVNKEWFRYLIGKALVFGFDRDYANATKMLFKAEQYFRARSEELSRWWYLTASLACALPFMVLGAVVWMRRDEAELMLGNTVFLCLLFLVAGAIGALLSIIMRSGQLNFDCSAGRWLHRLEALSRIVMGALAGVVVGLALKSKLFLEPLSSSGEAFNILMVLAAFAGGSSERLLGSIISKFDPNASNGTDTSGTPKSNADSGKGAPEDARAVGVNRPS